MDVADSRFDQSTTSVSQSAAWTSLESASFRTQIQGLLSLDQETEWRKRADGQEFVLCEAFRHERQGLQRLLGLFD